MMQLTLTKMDEAVTECMNIARRHANDVAASVTEYVYAWENTSKVEAKNKVFSASASMNAALEEIVRLCRRSEPLADLVRDLENEAESALARIRGIETVESCEGTDCE